MSKENFCNVFFGKVLPFEEHPANEENKFKDIFGMTPTIAKISHELNNFSQINLTIV